MVRSISAKKNFTLNLFDTDVEAVRKTGAKGYEVDIGKRKMAYPYTVLATGNVRPISPNMEGNVQNYYSDPYVADYDAIKDVGEVALIGSGLSARCRPC